MMHAPTHLPDELDPALAALPLPAAAPSPGVLSAVPASPAPRATTPLMRKEHRDNIALFRYQVIRGVADPGLSTRQRGPLVKALAQVDHPWPFGGTRRYSRETLDRWTLLCSVSSCEAL
jgi:putative transposase